MHQLNMLLKVHLRRIGSPASDFLNSLHHTPLNMLKVYLQLPLPTGRPLNMLKVYYQLPPQAGRQQEEDVARFLFPFIVR